MELENANKFFMIVATTYEAETFVGNPILYVYNIKTHLNIRKDGYILSLYRSKTVHL